MNHHKEKGFTVVELLVAMTTMSVVVTAAFAFLFSQIDAQRFGVQLAHAQQKTSLAIQRLTSDLRMAGHGCSSGDPVFDVAGCQEVCFWAAPYSDSLPRLVRYFLRQKSPQHREKLLIRCTGRDTLGQVVSSHVIGFALDYLDADGVSLLRGPSGGPAVSPNLHHDDINLNGTKDIFDIRRISIVIRTRTEKPRNGAFGTCELKSEVAPRNLPIVASRGNICSD